ncbi:MAG TPA: nitronate monooxygenase family protein [Phenylobacterium sp.]
MKTRITELFSIQHPILQGGMHFVGFAEMAAAVSNAGGLGIITGLTQRTPELLAKEIARCREMTDKPFGVNLTFLPSVTPPDYPGYVQAIVDGGVKIVETAGNNPAKWLPGLKEAGIKVIHKCTSVRHSVSAVRNGVDIVSIDGFECAGHPGEDDIGLIVLLPATVDALGDVPVIASGGMADGRSLAAALALGADGVNMGTRFMATQECAIHENVKKKIVENTERDTLLTNRTLRNTSRVARNAVSEEVVAIQQDPTKTIEDVRHLVAGVRGRKNVMGEGDTDGGIWTVGQSQGLIHDIPTCKQLVENIMRQAEAVLEANARRLA